jgi:hypothetical protein
MANLTATEYGAVAERLSRKQGDRALIGNNTTARWAGPVGGDILVSLHGHSIVTLHADGSVSVRDCGYVTTTTYDRLSAFLRPLGLLVTRRGGTGRVFHWDPAIQKPTMVVVAEVPNNDWARVTGRA